MGSAFGNVTYRGSQIGKVTVVDLTANGRSTLVAGSLSKVPADLKAAVRSMSAVGEQYVDLLPLMIPVRICTTAQ